MRNEPTSFRTRLYVFAVAECLLLLPAAILLTVAAASGLQPHEYEPAHTGWIIFEWMTTHHTRMDAAMMFLVFPAVALILGLGTLLQSWRQDELLRWDANALFSVVRRNVHFIVLTAGTLAGAAILAAAVVHIITD